jgi:hypothetical protein
MKVVVTPLGYAAALLTLSAGGGRVLAQVPADVRWSLEGNRGSYCIWYLADPDLARQMVPAGVALAPAGTGAGLPPLLARTVQDEPRFGQWIPGAICIGAYLRVTADGRTLVQGKAESPVIVGTSSLGAHQARGLPTASNYLIDFMTDKRSLARAADAVGFGMGGISVLSKNQVGADDPRVSISVDGVQITWSGHAIGDSGVVKTRSVSFGYATGRGARWLIELESVPASTRLMAGTLEVDGRNTLARALKASPVRAIGPEESGGVLTLTFHQATHQSP